MKILNWDTGFKNYSTCFSKLNIKNMALTINFVVYMEDKKEILKQYTQTISTTLILQKKQVYTYKGRIRK